MVERVGILLAVLIVIHVLAAIVGIGPAFILPVVGKSARTADQLRFVFGIMGKINKFPKIGGITLLVSGVLLMIVGKTGFSLLWLDLSLILFVVIEIIIIGFVEPRMKKIAEIVFSSKGDRIPDEFVSSMKRIVPLESTVHFLTLIIIVLMTVKPF